MLTKGAVRDNLPPVARALALHEFKMASHVKTRKVDDKDLLRKLYGRAYPSKMNKIQVCFRFRARQLRGLQEEEEEKRKVFVVPREAIDIDAVETMMKGRSGDSWNPGWMNASTRK
ncbi:hypothetical protein LSH36_395g01038 [Paralvinella palmiformis]|uniref:Uncharacterized protein n=1 Tax=Paralvinella palmiformis TaxID=53620 RepID=A0AAD9MZ00_9ANNE|nr:hypothetical protein LSH36_395g01038 [Paralvinella palmiformis]